MTHNDARNIVTNVIQETAPDDMAAERVIADAPAFERLLSSLIEAVTVADPQGRNPQAAADAAETWVTQFEFPSAPDLKA